MVSRKLHASAGSCMGWNDSGMGEQGASSSGNCAADAGAGAPGIPESSGCETIGCETIGCETIAGETIGCCGICRGAASLSVHARIRGGGASGEQNAGPCDGSGGGVSSA
ncbi:hypothetical protein IWW55_006729, partial [Coemansia sp. RSA 2706]